MHEVRCRTWRRVGGGTVLVLVAVLAASATCHAEVSIPRKLGVIYWKRGSEYIPLERVAFTVQEKSDGGAKSATTMGAKVVLANVLSGVIPGWGGVVASNAAMAGAGDFGEESSREVFVHGEASPVRIADPRPVFAIRGATDYNSATITRLVAENGRRGISERSSVHISGSKASTNARMMRLDAEIDSNDPAVVLLTPVGDLPPGEYEMGPPGNAFCFGVDAAPRRSDTTPQAEPVSSSSALARLRTKVQQTTETSAEQDADPEILDTFDDFIEAHEKGSVQAAAKLVISSSKQSFAKTENKMSRAQLRSTAKHLRDSHYVVTKSTTKSATLSAQDGSSTIAMEKENGLWKLDPDHSNLAGQADEEE